MALSDAVVEELKRDPRLLMLADLDLVRVLRARGFYSHRTNKADIVRAIRRWQREQDPKGAA